MCLSCSTLLELHSLSSGHREGVSWVWCPAPPSPLLYCQGENNLSQEAERAQEEEEGELAHSTSQEGLVISSEVESQSIERVVSL